ncbi:hypothetical protein MN186_11275 [Aliiroseovarius sp. N1F302]|nr:hypothetical protein [Aliiroseovarius sediminis]MCI2395034.1 hypothetical protein [Aliiroseovarius sediminis]
MLHTGHGAATPGLVLGLMALGVPAMGATGVSVWLAGRRGRPRIRGNRPVGRAEAILLVGSEGGSTWGFAVTLHAALSQAGQSVHVGPMSGFAPERYVKAERVILLAATYGAGAAPGATASQPTAPSPKLSLRQPERSAEPNSCRSTRSTVSRRRISRVGAARSARRLGPPWNCRTSPSFPKPRR